MNARQHVVDVVLRKHDLSDFRKQFRLVILHPEDLRCGKTCKGNVTGQFRKPGFSDFLIQPVGLRLCTSVIPQDSGTQYPVAVIQGNQSVHLSAGPDPGHFAAVKAFRQITDAFLHGPNPVLGFLFRPARVREKQFIFFRHDIPYFSFPIHQEQLDRRRTQINSDIQHLLFLHAVFKLKYLYQPTKSIADNESRSACMQLLLSIASRRMLRL